MFVCLGVLARGGGSRGVLRRCKVSSTSGAEPNEHQSQSQSNCMRAHFLSGEIRVNLLSCSSIAFELDVPCACFGGEAGEEKMPDTGSKPCSSRTPVSCNVIPVFLPTLPTSKYWLPVLPLRPGVLREPFLASFCWFAAAMLRG